MKFCYLLCLFSFLTVNIIAQKPMVDLSTKIDRYVKDYTRNNDFSGVVLVAKKDSILFEKAYGYCDAENKIPNSINTLFRISSVTKTFTAALVSKLKDQGLLKYEDKVSKYIPDYPNGNKITLDQLLNHRSGIPDYSDLPDYKTMMNKKLKLEELVDIFKDQPLVFEPGTSSLYSSSNYSLLALIIEKIEGKPIDDILKKEIIDAVALRSTGIDQYENGSITSHAKGYKIRENHKTSLVPPYHIENLIGSGYLYSNAEDMFNWVRAVLGSRIYDVHKDPLYGWGFRKYFNKSAIEQSGRTDGFISYISYFLNDGLTVVFLGNIESYAANKMGKDLAAIYFNEAYTSPEYRKEIKLNTKTATQWTGSFSDSTTVFIVSLKDQHLYFSYNNSKTLHELIPLSKRKLFLRLYGVTLFLKNNNEIEWSDNTGSHIYKRITR